MITLSLIKSAGSAAKYYAEDNYYLTEVDAKEASEWLGKGAVELGLKGRVEEQDLHNVLEGKLPNGITIGLQKDGKINHRAGYDICFHAPKSVSILALVGKDQRFYDAHVVAVKETLALIERDCAQAKVFKDNKLIFQNTKNLSIALVKHTSSRELDPQLHHHALVMNVTKRADGGWKALASSTKNTTEINGFSERIYKNRIYYGLIYQSSLANKVIQLGCEIESVGPHGLWEIKGVPKEAREALSKRRQQIEEQLSKLHYKSLKAADVAALDTREKKVKGLKLDNLREIWENELAAVGFSAKDFIAGLSGKMVSRELHDVAITLDSNKQHLSNKENEIYTNAKEAIENAVTHLSRYSLKLDYAKLLSQALEFSIGKVMHKELIVALNEQIKDGAIIPIDNEASLFVTKDLLDTEKDIISLVARGKEIGGAINLKASVLSEIRECEIKDCAIKALRSNERLGLIESRLTDNTEFISNILNLAEASGKTVRILSPNRITASDVNENIKRKPNNIWQWLVSLGKPELGESVGGFKYQYARELEAPLLRFRQGKDVVLVHNAETLGAKDMQELLQLTEASGAKVIFLQNTGFRPSINAGNAMATLKQAGIDTFSLKPGEKTKSLIPTLTIIKENSERTCALARTYAEKEDKERNNTIVLVGSKEQVKTTNQVIREELKSRGKLSNIETTIKALIPVYMSNAESTLAHRYKKNMLVRFYNEGVPAADWKIESLNKEKTLLRLVQNSKKILWNPKKDIRNHALFKEEELRIAKGDKLVALGKMSLLEIKNGTKLTVAEVGDGHIKLLSSKKTINVRLKDLHNSHLQHDYAATLSKYVKKEFGHILADFKAYSLDKQVCNELTRQAKDSLTIFTNDQALAENRLGYNSNQLTAVETIFDARKSIVKDGLVDRTINDKTINELKQDIEKAVLVLNEHYIKTEAKSIESKAVDFAVEKITSHNAGFTHKELVTEALTYALRNVLPSGNTATHEDILKAVTEKRNAGELVMGKYFDDGTRWTTKEILDLERSIINDIKKWQGRLTPILDQKTAQGLIEKTNLTQDQKNACRLITTTNDQFVIIQGYAGTGKTTMFSHVQNMIKEANIAQEKQKGGMENKGRTEETNKTKGTSQIKENIEMLALAPTHRAVKELKSVGINAQTLKSFLIEHRKDVSHNTNDIDINSDTKHYELNTLDNKLIVLDEASMVSNKDFAQFLHVVGNSKGRVVLSGDIAQHIAVGSGKPFEIVQKANILKTVYLYEIVRQKNLNLKEAVESVIHKDYVAAFAKIANENPQDYIKRTKSSFSGFSDFFDNLKKSIVEVDNNKIKSNEKTLEQRVAEDFLSRTPETRDQTVIIVHANQDRRGITDLIRQGLKEQGDIAEKGMKVNCLVPKGLTDTEHKSLGSYSIGDAVKFGKEYYHVVENDQSSKCLLLKDEAGKTKYFYPEKYVDKYNVELYAHTKAELAVGDTIRLTKTDKERELYANFEYKVKEVNDGRVILESRDDGRNSQPGNEQKKQKEIVLDPNKLKDAHWDYAQTVTGYGIQGGSKTYAIDFEVSYRKHLANLRSFYIGISRAIEHLIIYTDNKEKLLSRIFANRGDKYAALEVAGDIDNTVSNNNINDSINSDIATKATKEKEAKEGYGEECVRSGFYDAKETSKLLNNSSESFVERLLGRPNEKLSSASEWRYGNKGSLVISMADKSRGLWHNFETGESGNLLTLIQKETGLSFRDSLKYVANMFGDGLYMNASKQHKSDKVLASSRDKYNAKENKTSKYAQKIALESLPIADTIVEKYLKEIRGINNIDSFDIRYHPKVYTGNEGQKYLPAMLSLGRDKDGNVQCVQATYLDLKTANKADLNIKKRTYSSPSGASVLLGSHEDDRAINNKNKKNSLTFVAEGVETGLSIKDAVKDPDVFVTLGKSNFASVDPKKTGSQVVFCLDNDGAKSHNDLVIHKAAQRLIDLGKEVFIAMPNQLNNTKTDFNDVANSGGISAVKDSLDNAVSYNSWKNTVENSVEGLTKSITSYSKTLEQKSKNLFNVAPEYAHNKPIQTLEHERVNAVFDNSTATKTEVEKTHPEQKNASTLIRQNETLAQKTLVNMDREL
jgi:conjugative transfer relaxase protein TraI